MDLGSSLLYLVSFVVLSAIGPARGSAVDQMSCLCLEIPLRPLTEPLPGTCFQKSSRFRYRCIEGYVRKAGTSDLTICKETEGFSHGNWSTPSLVCIPDPRRTTKQPPVPDPTEKTATRLQMTQSSVPSTTVTAESNNTDPTSFMSDQSHATETESANDTKTLTPSTASPSDNSTADPLMWDEQSSGTAAWVTCAALAIVCAAIGISFWCYKRRSKRNIPLPTAEEMTHMNPTQPGLVI
ncbi:interleukin-15 receptor subunit alpha isoform X2 [Halichoeres trimaculatus]|uniref:interleukin-15 receptor subunit alpha isoform X2 n=1 Tax=Halichoeres trimaculatus TaxID=147232 RepID=UPI003D9F6A09